MSSATLLFHEWEAEANGLLPDGGAFPTKLCGTLWAGGFDDAEVILLDEYNADHGVELTKLKLVQRQPDGSGSWTRRVDFSRDRQIITRSRAPATTTTEPSQAVKQAMQKASNQSKAKATAAKATPPIEKEAEHVTPDTRKGKKKGKKGKRNKDADFFWFGSCEGVSLIPAADHHSEAKEIRSFTNVVRTTA